MQGTDGERRQDDDECALFRQSLGKLSAGGPGRSGPRHLNGTKFNNHANDFQRAAPSGKHPQSFDSNGYESPAFGKRNCQERVLEDPDRINEINELLDSHQKEFEE